MIFGNGKSERVQPSVREEIRQMHQADDEDLFDQLLLDYRDERYAIPNSARYSHYFDLEDDFDPSPTTRPDVIDLEDSDYDYQDYSDRGPFHFMRNGVTDERSESDLEDDFKFELMLRRSSPLD